MSFPQGSNKVLLSLNLLWSEFVETMNNGHRQPRCVIKIYVEAEQKVAHRFNELAPK